MFIRIEASSAVPIYRQILDQIKEHIACGLLRPGEQMPSVRQVADELAVNQNTILKVYNELCRDGILKVERGSGTFVSDGFDKIQQQEKLRIVREVLAQAAQKAHRLGVALDTLCQLLSEEYRNLSQEASNA
jgi:GntR family transcriptional regulator